MKFRMHRSIWLGKFDIFNAFRFFGTSEKYERILTVKFLTTTSYIYMLIIYICIRRYNDLFCISRYLYHQVVVLL